MNQYALELSELSKYYDDKPVIKNISLSLKSGEILGILGQNASAKSTLIKILGGLVQPNRGQISLFGEQVKIKSPSKATALGIIALYENSPLPENLTVSQALFLGTYRKINPRSVASSIGLVSNKKMDLEAKRYLEEYNFDVDIRSKVDSLSPAQRQMLVLIRSVVLNAKILLVDNCFSLLNASEIKEVH
ncbi:MAG: ATP-binding cassette domain-containing protein, partial [Hungatella sp.]